MDFKCDPDISNIDQHIAQIEKNTSLEMHSILYQVAKKIKPKAYLEIGVLQGRSMALVLKASPETDAYGIDLWKKYSGYDLSKKGVMESMEAIGVENLPVFYTGFSYEILPELWNDKDIPDLFDLILVDGDHSLKGSKKDLNLCFTHLEKDGVLIFHDIAIPRFIHLRRMIQAFKFKHSDCLFIESYTGPGLCLITGRSFMEILNG